MALKSDGRRQHILRPRFQRIQALNGEGILPRHIHVAQVEAVLLQRQTAVRERAGGSKVAKAIARIARVLVLAFRVL